MATVLLSGGDAVRLPAEQAPFPASSTVKVGTSEKIQIGPDDGSEMPSGYNAVSGLLRISTYIGVNHQYKVEAPAVTSLTVWVQNLGATPPAPSSERVRLSWR